MPGYRRDWNEFEKDVGETRQATEEELEYLSLRQKLKESYRERLKKDRGTANSGSTTALPNDKFGSFFGPSQPVISQRVIQESRSLLAKSVHEKMSDSVRPKSKDNNKPIGLKNRAEMLKNARDYSFLLSKDADVRCSDVGDGRKPVVASSHGKPKAGPEKANPAVKPSMEYHKHVGPERSLGPKSVPSKNTTRKSTQQPVAIKRSLPQKEHQETKVISKQASMPSSRDQLKQRAPLRDEHPRTKPKAKRQLLGGNDISSMIRKLMRYDPSKCRDDDDDSNMVANFSDIQKEEKRSAVIARREDEEQLRLIEEEKKMHLAKKHKLSRV